MSYKKSKYYYDYTRNMSENKQLKICNCDKEMSTCICVKEKKPRFSTSKWKESVRKLKKNSFDSWVKDLQEEEQPQCSIDNPDCENCGS